MKLIDGVAGCIDTNIEGQRVKPVGPVTSVRAQRCNDKATECTVPWIFVGVADISGEFRPRLTLQGPASRM